ncbi:hypothetical protein [Bradyrhizobium sp. 930_D9_N1_4]|uniref:hypothetical protein n=1 Tax=Bradyrhizobium sp. 930_D9_N1_4 TaxID=3240374 RepID=UPI003F8BAF67
MYQRWIVWILFASIMGFASGGSVFWGLYGPNATIERVSEVTEHPTSHHEAKSKKEETDEALAYYTLWLTVFTGVLAFATIALGGATFGLYFTGEKQIKFLRESSEVQSRDMQASLKIAKDAATAAAEAAYSERAWITPDGIDAAAITNLFVDGVHYSEGLGAIPKWTNTGRSPAIQLEIFTTAMIVPLEATIPVFDMEVPNPENMKGILGPTIQGTGQMMHICGEDLSNLKARKVKWVIYSRAVYSTVFQPDIRRVSEICARAEWNGEVRQSDGSSFPRINFTATGPQNGAA